MPKIPKGNPDCEQCGLCNVGNSVCLMGTGKLNSKIMVVGDAVGFKEDENGVSLSGKPGQLIKSLLKEQGIDPGDLYYTHSVKCRTPEGKPPSAKEIKACTNHLQEEIKNIKPDFVLLMGATALKSALGKAKITEIHGNPIKHKDGITYFPMFSPGIAIRDPKRMGPLKQDVLRFARTVKGEQGTVHKLRLTIVDSLEKLRSLCVELYQCKEFAYDIETTGLNRFADDAAVTMQVIATENGEWVIPLNIEGSFFFTMESQRLVLELLVRVTRGKGAFAQNGKFDNLYTEFLYGVKFDLTFDTMLASHLVDENSPLGLKYIAQRYLDAHNWEVDLEVKKGMKVGALQELCEYAAWDGHFTLKLKHFFESRLKEDPTQIRLSEKLVMPVGKAYENFEPNGTYINTKKMAEVKAKTEDQMVEALRLLNDHYDIHYRKKKTSLKLVGDNKELVPLENVNWNSSKQIGSILFDHLGLTPEGHTPKGDPSTAADFLNRMAGQHPILTPLLDYRHAQKIMSSFIVGWEKRMVNDRYLFPGFKVPGTVTGRPSCSDPNLQQVPRNIDIRSQISAPPGWVFFEVDYSQLELRIAAIISGDREMTRIFQTGGDIHSETASAVTGIPLDEITKDDRKKAKAVNFGFIYGMGAPKFRDYARDKYGVILTMREADNFRIRYFEKYGDLLAWHERQRRIVRALGQVRTFTGRIRHLPEIESPDRGLRAEAERGAINAPVQGFGAEMLLMALVDLDKVLIPQEIKVCGTIHDALVGRVKIRKKTKWMKIIKKTMENPSLLKEFGIDLSIPITVAVSVGDWGVGEELDL